MTKTDTLTAFLSSLALNPAFAQTKTMEIDLKGSLNPTVWLHQTFFEQNNWLSFSAFYDYYLQKNEAALRILFAQYDWQTVQDGLAARLYRTQFGMLTEYHAYFLCQDFFGENNVVRSANLDKLGVDFQVYLDEQCYNIHIFVDTERAWYFRREKAKYKQGNKIAGLHVNLPYALSPRRFNSLQRLPNGFGVYSQSYLAYLKSEIQSGNIKNDNIIGTTADGFVYQTL